MIDINRIIFLYTQQEFSSLTDSALAGLTALLGYMNADKQLQDTRWQSYCLSTVLHECAGKWQPIEEDGKGKGLPYGQPDKRTGQVYFGRGYVQLTWHDNYLTMGEALHVDLVNHPDLALQPDIA